MKLPEIYGKNKIRDSKILQLFLDGESETDIAINMNLSQSRVSQIVYRNRSMLNADKALEKAKRINFLKRLIKRKDPESKKDIADLIDQLRIEVEGNKVEHSGKVDGGVNINVTPQKVYVFRDIVENDESSNGQAEGRDSVIHAAESSESIIGEEKV